MNTAALHDPLEHNIHPSNTSSSHTFVSEAHCHQSQIPMIQSSLITITLDHLPVIASFHFPNLSRPSAPNSSTSPLRNWSRASYRDIKSLPSINHCMSCSRLHQETQVSWPKNVSKNIPQNIQTPWIEDCQKISARTDEQRRTLDLGNILQLT